MDLAGLLPRVESIARAAGERIMEIYDSPFAVEAKDDDSPLTAADLAAHETIVAALGELTPDVPVMSEESKAVSWDERRTWQRFWLVDPLDGTKEFVKRNGEFTVNIALVDDGVPVLGVVHAPALDRTYAAALGHGAFRRDGGGEAVAISVRAATGDVVEVVGSRSHAGPHLEAFVAALGPHELVSMGSSLKLCLVAEGAADVYPRLGLTSEWDTAAAQCVVEVAGGAVWAVDGTPLRCNRGESVLNPFFVAAGPRDRDWLALLPEL